MTFVRVASGKVFMFSGNQLNLLWVLHKKKKYVLYRKIIDIPNRRSLTSDAALSPSARNALSIFLERSTASLSLDVLTAQPIFWNFFFLVRRYLVHATKHTTKLFPVTLFNYSEHNTALYPQNCGIFTLRHLLHSFLLH